MIGSLGRRGGGEEFRRINFRTWIVSIAASLYYTTEEIYFPSHGCTSSLSDSFLVAEVENESPASFVGLEGEAKRGQRRDRSRFLLSFIGGNVRAKNRLQTCTIL